MSLEYITATKNFRNKKYIVGIDEAGRGPLAGPVSVGVFVFIAPEVINLFKGVKDSKKLSAKKRDYWFSIIKKARKIGGIDYSVKMISNKIIDKNGIVFAIKEAMAHSLRVLKISPKDSHIFLDGGLYAPQNFKNQKTIIKGDEKIMAISLASIVAKVTRDKKMIFYSKKYPQYGFEINKGYGTKRHIKKISKHGLSPIHRKSFLKSFDK